MLILARLIRWKGLLIASVAYLCISWLLLWVCQEPQLTKPDTFFYWLMVTASTVGYGDYSPETAAGRWVVTLFIIPIGLMGFGVLVGRIIGGLVAHWRRSIMGLRPIKTENHILVMGWNQERTESLLKLLIRERPHQEDHADIVLCVKEEIENPLPDHVHLVRVSSFSHHEDMARASAKDAACIIIDGHDDDATSAAALYITSINPDAHVIAHFNNKVMGKLMKSHFPRLETMPSVVTEMFAKSAVDPGSSRLIYELLNVDQGMTQYSCIYDQDIAIPVHTAFRWLKQVHDATLIAIEGDDGDIHINPSFDNKVLKGNRIYYIADERISGVDWSIAHD
ncbi:ion channel [Halomonas litopenaei]|uniref:ion channel n=1 Tax=Halomonas litopenaei TaxID=2109328 RepID=UPI001A8EC571|nr:two pore domain potassium channel family protein [Halomonas litopenaei]